MKFENQIIQGDCLEVMKRFPAESIDLVVTSPPYDNLRKYKGYSFDFEGIAKELYRVIKDGGVVVWVVGDATVDGSETGTSFRQALYFKEIGFNLHDTMIYSKNKAPINQRRYEDKFEFMFVFSKGKPKTFNGLREPSVKAGSKQTSSQRDASGEIKPRTKGYSIVKEDKLIGNIWWFYCGNGEGDKIAEGHPARFPEKLAGDHIKSWSNECDVVLDPMCGSGTTLKMAKILKRNYIGIEVSPEYIKIAQERINGEYPNIPSMETRIQELTEQLKEISSYGASDSQGYKILWDERASLKRELAAVKHKEIND